MGAGGIEIIGFIDDVADARSPILGEANFFEDWDKESEGEEAFMFGYFRVQICERDDDEGLYRIDIYDREDVFEIVVTYPDDRQETVFSIRRYNPRPGDDEEQHKGIAR